MSDHPKISEREEIELLLPWYETGQLTAEETQRVEAFLIKDAELRKQLALIREEVDETIAANEGLGLPSHAARDRLMAQVAAEGGAARKLTGTISGWMKRFSIAGLPAGLSLAGAMAAIVIVVQAVTLVALLSGDSGNGGARLASSGGETSVQTGTHALVRFQNVANAEDITALFRKTGIMIVDGPKPGGTFRVRISSWTLSEEDRDAFIADLRKHTDLVMSVKPAR